MNDAGLRAVSAFGFAALIGIAWLLSSDRRAFPGRTVAGGVALQLLLALVLLHSEGGRLFFIGVNALATRFLSYTDAGVAFVFGAIAETGFSFLANVLPVIIFMGSVFGVLYHLGVVQLVVRGMAAVLSRSMRLSGAESLSAVANVFVGMVEATLVVKPYLSSMTRSELFTLMTLGMSTVAGSVLLAYVGLLGGGDYAGHLVSASLLSAPAGLLLAKIMIPETEVPATSEGGAALDAAGTANVIDAAANGALEGLRLAAYVGAMLIAFVALIAALNDGIGWLGGLVGLPELSFQQLLGWLFSPLALLLGVTPADAFRVGELLGTKTVLNEFIAYQELGQLVQQGEIGERSAVIASYALCGFANFGSLAILLGGIGGMAPERRGEVAELGMRAIVAGTLATCMTGCVAGVLL